MTLLMDRVDRAGPAATPVRLRVANPVSLLFSAPPWACAAYLFSYLFFGVAAFVLCLVTVLVGSVLAVMWIGLPLLCAAFALGQGLAAAERGRARTVGARLNPPVRRSRGAGLRGYLIGRLRDRSTWRELLVLVVLWPGLLVLNLLALLIWLMGWVLISLPFGIGTCRSASTTVRTGTAWRSGTTPMGRTAASATAGISVICTARSVRPASACCSWLWSATTSWWGRRAPTSGPSGDGWRVAPDPGK
jgi:hypothetical protein